MQRNTGYFPTESLEPCGNRLFGRGRQAHPQPFQGYRQRVGLACALLGDPPVIILDEPTVGLDPKQIIEIRELIRSLGQEHTVLLSSHILSEVNAVCDKVLIMSHGKLVACDTPENLTAHAAGHAALRITVLGTQEAVQAALSPCWSRGAQAVEFVPCEEENAVTAPSSALAARICAHRRALRWRARAWPCCAWTPKQQAWRMCSWS